MSSDVLSIDLITIGALTFTLMFWLADVPTSISVNSIFCGSTTTATFSFAFSATGALDLCPNNNTSNIITTTNAAPNNIHWICFGVEFLNSINCCFKFFIFYYCILTT